MPNHLQPQVSQWYQQQEEDKLFEVISINDVEGTVDIQDFDGSVAEIDLDSWRDMNIEAVEMPTDWTGPFDNVDLDDPSDTEPDVRDMPNMSQ